MNRIRMEYGNVGYQVRESIKKDDGQVIYPTAACISCHSGPPAFPVMNSWPVRLLAVICVTPVTHCSHPLDPTEFLHMIGRGGRL